MKRINRVKKCGNAVGRNPAAQTLLLSGLICSGASWAETITTEIPDRSITWENTLKYSAAARLKSQDPTLISNPNFDDGDRNFNKGLISNRVDLLSEFDLKYKDFGLRVSGAAWYDDVYNGRNDNPGFVGGAFPNQSSAYDKFPAATSRMHGNKVELLDAFAMTRFKLSDMNGTVRLGQHALVWGESLFFGGNAIAGGMSPVDVTKLVSVPGTQFKEAIRPVPQVSGQIQITPDVTLGAYYQFRFEPNRLPAVGSYFSQIDANVDGGEQLLLAGPGSPFDHNAPREADRKAKNSGQGGVQLRFNHAGTDYGLYAIRFHNKSFQQVTLLGVNGVVIVPAPASYYLAYNEGINAYGASASRSFGSANVAGEFSIRTNQDLASSHAFDASAFGGAATDNSGNPGYAVGKTAHFNLSTLWLIEPTALFNEATLMAEVAWNRVLSCTKNCSVFDATTQRGVIDNNATRDAVALRVLFEPTYRQALPGVDLSVPIGVGYAPKGSRSMALGPGSFPADGGGDVTVGLNGTYLDAWRFTLAYTHFFGKAKGILDGNSSYSYGQTLKDRDFVSLSIRRTF
jgi:hypothetical protein